MSDHLNINVTIADRPYRLKLKPSEEEAVRQAAKIVNEKVKEFQQMYAGKDKQDFLAMSALMFAVESVNNSRSSSINNADVSEAIHVIDQALVKALR